MHSIRAVSFCPYEYLKLYAKNVCFGFYAANANMRILSIFNCDKKHKCFSVRTQKRTKTDENVYCIFSPLMIILVEI